MSEYTYPFDPTGTSSTNLIPKERHSISPPDWTERYFIVPLAGPFFEKGLKVVLQPENVPLINGVDFVLGYQFRGASAATAKELWGAISFLRRDISGIVEVTYQTLGGEWALNSPAAAETLANALYNPRTTTWEQVVELPYAFPVIDHEWDLVDMVGASALVDSINHMGDAVIQKINSSANVHAGRTDNPHNVSKAQIGLPDVPNYRGAVLTDLETFTEESAIITPYLLGMALQEAVTGPIQSHLNDLNNPHKVNKYHVGLGNVNDFPIATSAIAKSGSSNEHYMTPLRSKELLQVMLTSSLGDHSADTNNPHNVTKDQVGLENVANYPIAGDSVAIAGNSRYYYMTPLATKLLVAEHAGVPLSNHLNDNSNPHQVTSEQVGLGNVANLPLASEDVARVATSTVHYLTPATTFALVDEHAIQPLEAHVGDQTNPHNVTKDQVGLGNVANLAIAPNETAEAGTSNNHYITPYGARLLINAIAIEPTQVHIADKGNPHGVTKAQVGLGGLENYPVATLDDVVLAVTGRYVTSDIVSQAISELALKPFNDHSADTNNPHNVTKDQVGLGNVPNMDIASLETALLATSNTSFMTPMLTKALIDDNVGNAITSHVDDVDNPHRVTKTHVGLGQVDNFATATGTEENIHTLDNLFMTPMSTANLVLSLSDQITATHANRTDNPHQVTAVQIGAVERDEMDTALEGKLDVLAQASDSKLLEGNSVSQLMLTVDEKIGLSEESILAATVNKRTMPYPRDNPKVWRRLAVANFTSDEWLEFLAARKTAGLTFMLSDSDSFLNSLSVDMVSIDIGAWYNAGDGSLVEGVPRVHQYGLAGKRAMRAGIVSDPASRQWEIWLEVSSNTNVPTVMAVNNNIYFEFDVEVVESTTEPIGIIYDTDDRSIEEPLELRDAMVAGWSDAEQELYVPAEMPPAA